MRLFPAERPTEGAGRFHMHQTTKPAPPAGRYTNASLECAAKQPRLFYNGIVDHISE